MLKVINLMLGVATLGAAGAGSVMATKTPNLSIPEPNFYFPNNDYTINAKAEYYNVEASRLLCADYYAEIFNTSSLLKYIASEGGGPTGGNLMQWLDQKASGFDDGYNYTGDYINTIEQGYQHLHSDSAAYDDFRDHMGQPASYMNQYISNKSTNDIMVHFHYQYESVFHDHFDVTFSSP